VLQHNQMDGRTYW